VYGEDKLDYMVSGETVFQSTTHYKAPWISRMTDNNEIDTYEIILGKMGSQVDSIEDLL
jgi:hypothetical protein